MARRTKLERGFTLIELSVVLATIGILSSIAIPRVMNTLKRSRSVEAATTMNAIERSLKTYYNRHGEYPPNGARNPPRPDYSPSLMQKDMPGWKALDFRPEGTYRYRYSFEASVNGEGQDVMTVTALADTDADGVLAHLQKVYVNNELVYDDEISTD